ncbi:MAG TPA: coenzyme F420-0:L-glutamate ligase [Patescibacteria group bacterium]|nr:coenzyme F420-0:L-glutamate ligase [Patescibacteria group bacterium]
MIITPIKTHPIRARQEKITSILDRYITDLQEKSVVVITSKIISLCEGRAVPTDSINRDELAKQEAEYFLPRELNQYGVMLSINQGTVIASAGIDESNGDGHLVLWPKDLQKSVSEIRKYLRRKFHLSELGVIMTDSHLQPLRWGTVGTCIAFSGFQPVNNYIGTEDIFGRKLKVTKSNVAEGIAAGAVVAMGEGSEQTPIAVVSDVPFVKFVDNDPTQTELDDLRISKEDDIFGALLNSVPWQKGKKSFLR